MGPLEITWSSPLVRAGPKWSRLFRVLYIWVLYIWVLNVPQDGDALVPMGNLCNFLQPLIVVALFATCICCLLSFTCAPARKASFCHLYIFPLGSWRQQLDFPFPSPSWTAWSQPPSLQGSAADSCSVSWSRSNSSRKPFQPVSPGLSCCRGFLWPTCNALAFVELWGFCQSVSPMYWLLPHPLPLIWWTSWSVIPLNTTAFFFKFLLDTPLCTASCLQM